MSEYTAMSYGEVRFCWNAFNKDPIIFICRNGNPDGFISINISLSNLKKMNQLYYSQNIEKNYKDFKILFQGHNQILIQSLVQDSRKKSFKHPISFSWRDLDKVIKMVEEETK
jgi:hypothetical protein